MNPGGAVCARCGAANREGAHACYLCRAPLGPPPPGSGASLAEGRDPAPRGSPGSPRRVRPLSFYDAAARNARMSGLLFLLLFGVLFGAGGALGAASGGTGRGLLLAAVLFLILSCAAWYGGSPIVLSIHGAREADPEEHRQLLNVVEEMRIASGLPRTPKAYVMESAGRNAFAAGRRPEEGVVAVTTGLLASLTREELQGVVAHEMAHIRSRDTLYNVCAAVLVGAVAMLADVFFRGALFGRGRGGGGKSNPALFVLGMLMALLAPLAGKLLQMSISRQREYHADATAARFTRNPLGLARALEKIAAGSAAVPGSNRGTQHLFLVNPLRTFTEASPALWSTHPPTELRILRLRAMAGTGSARRSRSRRTPNVPPGDDLRQGHLTVHRQRS